MKLALDRFMADFASILMPAVAGPPFEIGFADPERAGRALTRARAVYNSIILELSLTRTPAGAI